MLSWPSFFSGLQQRRILWILNHKTLLPGEVPILEALGFEVFTPVTTPGGPAYLSAGGRHDAALSIAASAQATLKNHSFYADRWSPDLIKLINAKFDLVVTAVIDVPLIETLKHFRGPIIARVFGREGDHTYGQMFHAYKCMDLIHRVHDRFMLAAAYSNSAAIENDFLRQRFHTVGVPIPKFMWEKQNSWKGRGDHLLFLCPQIDHHPYYRAKYEIIKKTFGSMPHRIMGQQVGAFSDPSVMGYLSDEELFGVYASSAAFLYVSSEERHVHYSPVEAMIVGVPVLYLQGSLLAFLAGERLPGECASLDDMREKAKRLLLGDPELKRAITSTQTRILPHFSEATVKEQWKSALARFKLA